jgi:hypothetical protein
MKRHIIVTRVMTVVITNGEKYKRDRSMLFWLEIQ